MRIACGRKRKRWRKFGYGLTRIDKSNPRKRHSPSCALESDGYEFLKILG
jgi:hypothetical protein